jgi:O-antigen ligase
MNENTVNFSIKHFLTNFLMCFLPVSYILGNLALNLNILLIVLISVIIFFTRDAKFKVVFFDKIILIYFIYILFVGVFNYFETFSVSKNDQIIIKSISYLRYLLFYFAIRILIGSRLINLNIFYYACAISILFVALDIIIQYNFGKDIFGFEGTTRRLAGPFEDELVAGGYLQRFSFLLFFLFFGFSYLNKLEEKIKFPLFCLVSLVVSSSLVLAGNRIPLLIFTLTVIFCFFIFKKYKIYFLTLFLISIGSLIFFVGSNLEIKKHYGGFQTKIISALTPFSEENIVKFKDSENPTFDEKNYSINRDGKNYIIPVVHIKEFYSGIKTWSKNKFIGGGVKTFRFNCPQVYSNCNTHPHNYYLEILSDIGLVGLLMIFYLFSYVAYSGIINKNIILSPFIIQFVAEIFPFKSTGSFFTTTNSIFIFLLISIIISVSSKKDLN